MNKVLIRTRQIDNNKQLQILIKDNDDLSDFNEYSNISRSSQILSGMDKGEESEHHLQEVLRELQFEKTIVNSAIPIPEVHEECDYDSLYQTNFSFPKNYIRLKTLEFEDEFPEYDMDEEDKEWLESSKLNITTIKFEKIVEEFERACSQKAILLDEAKCLLRHEPVHIVISIYDYWLMKRVKTGQPLFLSIKAEKAERCNNTPIDPYIAFRKRSEKMTTRKNRRVDESSYEKMCRLKSHMDKLSQTIEFVLQREITKSQITQTERDIFIKRYESRDYDKMQLKDSDSTLKSQSIKLVDNFKSAQRSREENHKENKRKRPFSKTHDVNNYTEEHSSDDFDFTFKPMAKCKYLPSKFFAIENQNQLHNDTDQRSFSLAKLSHLPPPLHTLNTPIRLRTSRNGLISIDLKNPPLITHYQTMPGSTDHPRNYTNLSNPLFQESPMVCNTLMAKLYTLYNRDINCGLPPLNVHPYNDYQHNFTHNTSTFSTKPSPVSPKSHSPKSILLKHVDKGGDTKSDVWENMRKSDCNGTKLSLSHNHDSVIDEYWKHQSSKQTNNNISTHHNVNLCTYHNPSPSLDHNKNQTFNDFERQINGQKPSPKVTTKETVDNHHSLNSSSGGGGGSLSSKLTQVVSLNCLKSLTNKRRLIPRDDIHDDDDISFYSKSTNGHHQPKKWFKQSATDTCLKQPPALLPLWKSEPTHVVMTSVNKMA